MTRRIFTDLDGREPSEPTPKRAPAQEPRKMPDEKTRVKALEELTDEELRAEVTRLRKAKEPVADHVDEYHKRMAGAFVDGSAPKTERSAETDGDDRRAAHERRMNRAFIEPGDDAA